MHAHHALDDVRAGTSDPDPVDDDLPPEGSLAAALLAHGISRRSFLALAGAAAATLALPATVAPRIVRALETAPRTPLLWLRGQDCGGDTTAFLRATDPTLPRLLVESLSLDFHEALAGAAGDDAMAALEAAIAGPGGYLLVVEGSLPTAEGGVHCLVAGRPVVDLVRQAAVKARAILAVGSCAADGGAPAASGGTTDARPVEALLAAAGVDRSRLLNLPGCPVNADDLAATVVHLVTTGELPPADGRRRPLFAYGSLIHQQCERRAHFEFGEFSTTWGDEAAQKGWCLYKVGCKGPETYGDCPTTRYAGGVSWPVKAGHGCIGCRSADFWDAAGDAYLRLPSPVPATSPALPAATVDQLGGALLGGVGALAVVHGTGMTLVRRRRAGQDRRAAAAFRAGTEPPARDPGDGNDPGLVADEELLP